MNSRFASIPIQDLQKSIYDQEYAIEEITLDFLRVIREHNDHSNALLEVYEDEAIDQARALDQKIKKGQKVGKLVGVCLTIKDIISYKDHNTWASSRILKGYRPPFHSTVVERAIAEDAIILGRTNCDEFAMGGSNENSAYGRVPNPHDAERVSGGSSGGSAVSVALGMCNASLGTDTGGSVRQPASFCGIWGYKPSYGHFSRYGVVAFSSSCDQVGVFGSESSYIQRVSEVIGGEDQRDATSLGEVKKRKQQHTKSIDDKKYRIAVFKDYLASDALDDAIREKLLSIIQVARDNGCEVNWIDFPYFDYLIPTYYILTTAEASSNLARYDGVRYGVRADNVEDLNDMYVKTRSQGFGGEVKRRIMLGNFVLSSGYYDAYFGKAQKMRRVLQDFTKSMFANHDFLLAPVTPGVAFYSKGLKERSVTEEYLEDAYTVLANLTGCPAMTVPAGDKDGLPFGLQVMANNFEDTTLLQAGNYIHQLLEANQ